VPNGGYGPNIIGGDMNTRYSESPRNGLTHIGYGAENGDGRYGVEA